MLDASILEVVQSLPRLLDPFEVVVAAVVVILAAGHAILFKRDSRSAGFWVILIFFVPLVGAVFYLVFGINRVHRRAILLRAGMERRHGERGTLEQGEALLRSNLPGMAHHLCALERVLHQVAERPLEAGNRVEALVNGDHTYPAMLEAIASARHSVSLSTYIFDRDEVGLAFVDALSQARERGVKIRVLIDATGLRYSFPSILGDLRKAQIPYARFLPAFPFGRLMALNLRNHRKIMVVDGQVGFTGGMNIRVGHWLEKHPSYAVQDLHFRVTGPVVRQIQDVFSGDWKFTTGETLTGIEWFPEVPPAGPVSARAVEDGPDEDLDLLRWAILGALSVARRSICVMTPYFLPDAPIIAALNLASMRGVAVHIVLPERNNLPFVHWASAANWWQVLEHGCRIWLSPPPFDHSKLLLVDDAWCLIGSTNWDPRSLRLNFEFNLECYDPALTEELSVHFHEKRSRAREITLAEIEARSLPVKLRDGVARLFTPLL